VPSGFAELDRALPGGGWPWGAVIEIFSEQYGIGELSLWMPALASSSRSRGAAWIVFIAPPLIPYAPALSRFGIALDRVLLVDTASRSAESLWATEQTLRSGACAAVIAWLRSPDDTALRRLQLAAEARDCALLLFRPLEQRARRSPAALRVRMTKAGAKTRVEILKCRGGRPFCVDLCLPLEAMPDGARESACGGAARDSRTGDARCG
jgi:cell division inhibitor SulA/protein ImuA